MISEISNDTTKHEIDGNDVKPELGGNARSELGGSNARAELGTEVDARAELEGGWQAPEASSDPRSPT